jgi:hypothetical protein
MSGACGSVQVVGALGQQPPRSLVTANIFFAGITSYRHGGQGAAVDVFNISGGRCQKSRQQPTGGPPSTSLVVATAGPTASTHKGPTIDVFNIGGGRYRKSRQHPRGPAIDVSNFDGGCCQHHPGGPPSTSSTSVVAAAKNPDSNP